MLLAIFIFSVVITTVYGAYRTTFRNIQSTESGAEQAERARIILERLTADLESVYSGVGGYLRGEQGEISDQRADTITFTSTAHIVFHRSEQQAGLAAIHYSASEDEETGLVRLYRSDQPMLPGAVENDREEGVLLGEGIAAFRLAYVDGDGSETDSWESKSEENEINEESSLPPRMPHLVRIELRLAGSAEDMPEGVFRTAVAVPGALVKRKK